jgi:hypothetical protein
MNMHRSFKFLTAALMLAAAPWIVTSTVAAPISCSLGLQNAVPSSIETARHTFTSGTEPIVADRRANRWDRRANRWDRRAYRRGYGYDGYNAYAYTSGDRYGGYNAYAPRYGYGGYNSFAYAPRCGYGGYNAYASAPGATSSYGYGSEPIAESNRRSCLTEYAGEEELCGFYGALCRRYQ